MQKDLSSAKSRNVNQPPIRSPPSSPPPGYFQQSWGAAVSGWTERNGKALLEENFAPFIISVVRERTTPENVRDAFRRTGLCPWDLATMSGRISEH